MAQRLLAIVVTVISQIAVIMRDGHHAYIDDSTLYRCVAEVKRLVKLGTAGVLRQSVNQEFPKYPPILEGILDQRIAWWKKMPTETAWRFAGKHRLINRELEFFERLHVGIKLRDGKSHVNAVEQIVYRCIDYCAEDVRLKKKRMNRMKNELAEAVPVENVPRTSYRQAISKSQPTVLRIVALQKSGFASEVSGVEGLRRHKRTPREDGCGCIWPEARARDLRPEGRGKTVYPRQNDSKRDAARCQGNPYAFDHDPSMDRNIHRDINKAISVWGARKVKSIGKAEIEDFLYDLDRSAKTRAYNRSVLNTFWTWLVGRENGIKRPEVPKIKFELGWRNVIGLEDQATILAEIRRIPWHRNPRIRIGIKWLTTYIAIRPNEMRNLKERKIDINGYLVIPHPKRKKPKLIPMTDDDIEHYHSLSALLGRHRIGGVPDVRA